MTHSNPDDIFSRVEERAGLSAKYAHVTHRSILNHLLKLWSQAAFHTNGGNQWLNDTAFNCLQLLTEYKRKGWPNVALCPHSVSTACWAQLVTSWGFDSDTVTFQWVTKPMSLAPEFILPFANIFLSPQPREALHIPLQLSPVIYCYKLTSWLSSVRVLLRTKQIYKEKKNKQSNVGQNFCPLYKQKQRSREDKKLIPNLPVHHRQKKQQTAGNIF